MLIGLQVQDQPFVVVECPDSMTFHHNTVGAPDFSLKSGTLRPLEDILRYARRGIRGFRLVSAPDFNGTTYIVAGVLAYRRINGKPSPGDLFPGQRVS